MNRFLIDGFDFGLDMARSSVEIQDGKLLLKIVGDDAVIEKLNADEGQRWSWLTQAPFLYVLGVPCTPEPNGDFKYAVTEDDRDEYEIALYLGEHFDIDPCRIIRAGQAVTVKGMVHGVSQSPLLFQVTYERA